MVYCLSYFLPVRMPETGVYSRDREVDRAHKWTLINKNDYFVFQKISYKVFITY